MSENRLEARNTRWQTCRNKIPSHTIVSCEVEWILSSNVDVVFFRSSQMTIVDSIIAEASHCDV